MSVEDLELAQSITYELLSGVSSAMLGAPTPCKSWAVRDVVNHIVSENLWFASTLIARTSTPFDPTDFASGDYLSSYETSSRKASRAFAAAGALDGVVKLPYGEFPAAVYLSLAVCENFAHGWDLARATGQSSDLDAALAEKILAGPVVLGLSDEMRGPDGVSSFGPRQDADDGAPAADRLAAFLGRMP